jgi:hypothetical protein
VSETPATSTPAQPKPPAGRWRRILARVLTVIGILLAIIALIANFVRSQLLDTDQFRETAALMIQSEPIRNQVAATLVDELYANIDVKQEIEDQLPEDAQGLAAPLAAGARELAVRAAELLLERPRIQRLFIDAATLSHAELVAVLEGREGVVSTTEGRVVLDLRELVVRLGEEIGVGGTVADRIPAGAAEIEILESDELETAQEAVDVLDAVALWFWVLALVAWALAIWLARGYRRVEVRAIAAGLLIVGIAVLLIRTLAGNYLVNELVTTESVKPAADDAWSIVTRYLKDQSWTVIMIGIFALVGVWFTGPGRTARSAREALAPYVRRPEIAFGAYGVLALILIWWGPTDQWRSFVPVVVMVALGAIGVEAIRRQVAREFPAAVAHDLYGGVRAKFGEWASSLRESREPGEPRAAPGPRPATPAPTPAAGAPPVDLAAQLSALAALHEQGALSDDEFVAAKQRLLG